MGGVTETYTNDNADKLTSVTWSGGSKTYGYDGARRTTSVVTSAGTTTLSYDFEDRVTAPNRDHLANFWDSFGVGSLGVLAYGDYRPRTMVDKKP